MTVEIWDIISKLDICQGYILEKAVEILVRHNLDKQFLNELIKLDRENRGLPAMDSPPVLQEVTEKVRIRVMEGEKVILEQEQHIKKVVRDHLVQILFDGPIIVNTGQILSIEGPLL